MDIRTTATGDVQILVYVCEYSWPKMSIIASNPRPADRMPLVRWFLPRDKADMTFVTESFVFSGKSRMKVN